MKPDPEADYNLCYETTCQIDKKLEATKCDYSFSSLKRYLTEVEYFVRVLMVFDGITQNSGLSMGVENLKPEERIEVATKLRELGMKLMPTAIEKLNTIYLEMYGESASDEDWPRLNKQVEKLNSSCDSEGDFYGALAAYIRDNQAKLEAS